MPAEIGHRVVDAIDVPLVGDRLRPLRAALGIRAFGISQVELAPHWEGIEHDELATGHEELYAPIRGSGVLVIDGEDVAVGPGRFVVVEPASSRLLRAGAEGLVALVIGGAPGVPFEPRGGF
jgi:uncharacterized cupin superfamily protein